MSASLDSVVGRSEEATEPVEGLKQKTARGAVVAIVGQGVNFVLRTGSMLVFARLISPEQFGLVGMVAAFTGFLNLFRDAGLAQATVQRQDVTKEQLSTLFWINLLVGFGLAGICTLAAPGVAWFYGEPRLVWIMIALGSAFVFNGAGAQHRALLQREMKFAHLVVIDNSALILSIACAFGMAIAGLGHWALVMLAAGSSVFSMFGLWIACRLRPGLPSRGTGVRSMVHYGGMVTLNGLIMYLSNNVDKVLLGRVWGAEVLGIYGRAYQLISLPGENLNSTIGQVMFPALSRVQHDPPRLRNYFLKGYSVFLTIVAPIAIACGLFADDIVGVMLGSQWGAAVPVFAFLAPTIVAAAVISPLGCLMQATGRVVRSVKVSLLIAPASIVGYSLGLSHGPIGVAAGFSVAMLSLIIPVVAWARHGTLITSRDMLLTALKPLVASIAGGFLASWVGRALFDIPALARLVLVSSVLFSVHFLVLLFLFRQWHQYMDLWRAIRSKQRTPKS